MFKQRSDGSLYFDGPSGPQSALRATKTRPRDFQRSRLYRAENVVKSLGQLDSFEEARAYAHLVLRSDWWQNHQVADDSADDGVKYRHLNFHKYPDRVHVRGISNKYRYATASRAEVRFGTSQSARWSWTEYIIIHELIHVGVGPTYRHGPVFARTLIAAVEEFIGPDAAALLENSFVKHRVRWELPELIVEPEAVRSAARRGGQTKRESKRNVYDHGPMAAWRQTRKTYRCEECGREIRRGERYFDTDKRFVREGQLYLRRLCTECAGQEGRVG